MMNAGKITGVLVLLMILAAGSRVVLAQDSPGPATPQPKTDEVQPATPGESTGKTEAETGKKEETPTPAPTDSADNAEGAKKDETETTTGGGWGTGWVSLGATLVDVSGDRQSFRQDHWMDDHGLFGIRGFRYYLERGGWKLDAGGRGVNPDDYGLDVTLGKKGVGFGRIYFDEFPSYTDSSIAYYNYKPFVYHLDMEPTLRRRQAGVDLGWEPRVGPSLYVRYNHWERDGTDSTLWGGQVTDGVITRYFYPQFADVNQGRNSLNVEIAQSLSGFNFKVGVDFTDFEGTTSTNQKRFDKFGLISQQRFIVVTPDFREVSPYFEMTAELIKDILRWEVEARYTYTTTRSGYGETTLPSTASRATNFVNNEHRGHLNETIINTRLLYTPTTTLTFFGGIGVKIMDEAHWSQVNNDTTGPKGKGPPDGIADVISHFDNTEKRRVWMGNAGVEYKPFQWLSAKAEGAWEHHDVRRHWVGEAVLGAGEEFEYLTTPELDRVEAGGSVTVKPCRNLKFIGRYRHTSRDEDYPTTLSSFALIDTDDGLPDPVSYPGFVGNNKRRISEWSVLADYKPWSFLWLTYKVAIRDTDYLVEKEPVKDIADWDSVIHSASVTVAPIERLTLTASGSVQKTSVSTKAEHAAKVPIPAFDGDATTWSLDANYGVTRKLSLLAGVSRTNAESIFDYRSTQAYVGGTYQFNETWSADARYTFLKFDEKNNGDIDNYKANVFTVGLTGKF